MGNGSTKYVSQLKTIWDETKQKLFQSIHYRCDLFLFNDSYLYFGELGEIMHQGRLPTADISLYGHLQQQVE